MQAVRAELSEGCPSGRLYGAGLALRRSPAHLLQCDAAPAALKPFSSWRPGARAGAACHELHRTRILVRSSACAGLSELAQTEPLPFCSRASGRVAASAPQSVYVLEQRIARAQVRLMEIQSRHWQSSATSWALPAKRTLQRVFASWSALHARSLAGEALARARPALTLQAPVRSNFLKLSRPNAQQSERGSCGEGSSADFQPGLRGGPRTSMIGYDRA